LKNSFFNRHFVIMVPVAELERISTPEGIT
jgi:hypothetical protein